MLAARSITPANCLLDPVAIIHLFLTQILHGNTAINHLVRISGLSFTDSAYCQAGSRLPLALFHELLRRVTERIKPAMDETGTWHGHRVFVADGSSFSIPDLPELQKHFGHATGQRPGCGFPVAHFLALFHVGTGMLAESWPHRFGLMTCPAWRQIIPGWKTAIYSWATAACARSRTWRCSVREARMASSACINVRSSISHRIELMLDQPIRKARRDFLIRGGCAVWPDGPSCRLAQARTRSRMDDGCTIRIAAG